MLKKVELFLLRADTEATTMREKKKKLYEGRNLKRFPTLSELDKNLGIFLQWTTGHHSSPGYFPEDIIRKNNHAFVASNEPQPTSSHSNGFIFSPPLLRRQPDREPASCDWIHVCVLHV